jgi:hypothetical protein
MTLTEVLVVTAIIVVLMALVLPAIQRVRETALMLRSYNNLRQIGIGFHHLGSAYDGKLPGCVWRHEPYRDSTFIELLPYLEQQSIYDRRVSSDFRLSLEDHLQWPVQTFVNPLDPSIGRWNQSPDLAIRPIDPAKLSVSSYALNAQFWAFYPHIDRITDGLSNTIWLAEHYAYNCSGTTFVYVVDISSHWRPIQPATFAHGGKIGGRPAPGDYYPITSGTPPTSTAEDGKTFQARPPISEADPRLANSSSSRGLQVCMADGSVRLLAPSISPNAYWGAVTPAGGEAPGPDW